MLEQRVQISSGLLKHLNRLLSERQKNTYSKDQINIFINITCQHSNLLNYENFDDRQLHEQCFNTVVQLLQQQCQKGDNITHQIIELFLHHQKIHPECHISMLALWKIINKQNSVAIIVKKKYFDQVVQLIEKHWRILDESFKLNILQRNRTQPLKQNIIQKTIHQITTLPRPTRRQQRQKTQTFGKVPPLIVPTSSIMSSRFDLNQTTGTAIEEFEKLATSLGEGIVGIQLGILMNKRRSQQVSLFEQSQQYRMSLQQNSQQKDAQPTPRDLAMTQTESQKDTTINNFNPRQIKKVIIIACNILYKILYKDCENNHYQSKPSWLPKIFDILLSGCFQNFNRQISEHKVQNNILPKQIIFSKLFNLCALYSQQIHLNIILMKNTHQYQGNNQQPLEISDQLLRTMKIQKKRINKKIINKLGLTQFCSQELRKLKQELNQFIVYWKFNFYNCLQCYSVSDQTSFEFQTNLLNILANYLKYTQSRIASQEIIENIFEILIFVKRQILELSLPFLEERLQSSPSLSQSNFTKKQNSKKYFSPLIYTHVNLVGSFLNVISNLNANNRYVERLINNCFSKCPQFTEILKLYSKHIFKLQNYDLILKLLSYYKHLISVFSQISIKHKDNKPIKALFESISHLLVPKTGFISSYLQVNQNRIAALLRIKAKLNKQQSRSIIFFSELIRFCQFVFVHPVQINPILSNDTIISYYLRFSFLGFVKLYSFLTQMELKVLRQQQILNDSDKTSNTHHNHILLKRLLGLIKGLSSSRTQELSKKILHYRILQFFIRQLQLQFETNYNRKRRITNVSSKINNEKQQFDKALTVSDGAKKTPTVPMLNLNLSTQVVITENIEDMPTKKVVPTLKIPNLKKGQSPQSSSLKRDQGQLGSIISQIDKKYECSNKPLSLKIPDLSLKLSKIQSQPLYLNTQPKSNSDFNLTYVHERRMRKLYSSKTLHSQIVLLVLSLLLKKGLLDPVYCPPQIINQDKVNILLILHSHLNHPSNKNILPLLAQGVRHIQPYPSGQRLLKLLSTSFTNMNIYGQQHKLAEGGSGWIMTRKTKLQQPKQVIVKQTQLSNDIYKCKLTTIFNEITCLDNFKLQPKITNIYDFGVTQSAYVIIMKRYKISLRTWRRKQEEDDHKAFINLATYLNIFRQICFVVKLLHDQNVTHYDIKCDNVLLDYTHQEEMQQGKFKIVFADFGCCKMYENEKDEFDLMYRGTQVAMSPEMLNIASKNKKQSDDFDRRKSVGTTRASDIWSLGCLFYELLTGQYLFKNVFQRKVNTSDAVVFSKDDLDNLKNNIYLVDFLKFMLIKDPQHRPTINNVITRFEHIYSLLVPSKYQPYIDYASPSSLNQTLQGMLDNYLHQFQKQKEKIKQKDRWISETSNTNRGLQKIMKDIYLCDEKFAKQNIAKLSTEGITHVVTTIQLPKFSTILIKPGKQSPLSITLRLTPRLSDLIREVLMFKGKLLFVNNKTNYAVGALIYTLSIWFKCSVYETWCLINTQILEFPFSDDFLPKLSNAFTKFQKIDNHIQTLPKLQCVCCSVTMVLRRPLPDIKHDSIMCKCKKKKSECPSGRCFSYLQFLKKKYKIQWQQLIWKKVPSNSFLVGPFKCGQFKDSLRSQILINSADSNENLVETNSSDSKQWRLYKCKICEMWMIAKHKQGDIVIITNTQIKSLKQGIMIPNAQQGYKAKAPLLSEYTLSKLHLIEA